MVNFNKAKLKRQINYSIYLRSRNGKEDSSDKDVTGSTAGSQNRQIQSRNKACIFNSKQQTEQETANTCGGCSIIGKNELRAGIFECLFIEKTAGNNSEKTCGLNYTGDQTRWSQQSHPTT